MNHLTRDILNDHLDDISDDISDDNSKGISDDIQNENEEILFASGNLDSLSIAKDEGFNKPYPDGLYQTCCIIPGNFLNAGNYFISVNVQHDVNQHC